MTLNICRRRTSALSSTSTQHGDACEGFQRRRKVGVFPKVSMVCSYCRHPVPSEWMAVVCPCLCSKGMMCCYIPPSTHSLASPGPLSRSIPSTPPRRCPARELSSLPESAVFFGHPVPRTKSTPFKHSFSFFICILWHHLLASMFRLHYGTLKKVTKTQAQPQ